MDSRPSITPMQLWGLISAALIGIGSFGPWMQLGLLSRNALDGDGMFTLAIASIALGIVIFSRVPALGILLGAAAAAIAEVDGQDIVQRQVFGVHAQRGWGILLVEAAGISLLLWAIVQTVDATARREPS